MLSRTLRLLALGVVLALCFCAVAVAETVDLPEIGVRYTPADGELCVTRERQPDGALALLGVDRDTLLTSMQGDGAFLIALGADGRQLTLCAEARPDGLTQTDYHALDLSGKQQFLSLLARKDNYGQATWRDDLPGYALFAGMLSDADALMPYETVALSTLYLGRVLTLRTDVIGREATDDDTAALTDAAKRLLLLGADSSVVADASPATLALPTQTPLTEDNAVWTAEKNELPLTVNDIPAIVGSDELAISGTTQPKVNVRYILNGSPSSRFKADENGAFSTTVKDLSVGKNELEIVAFTDQQQSLVKCDVTLDWQPTPLALASTELVSDGDSVTVEGVTLPGAKVTLIRKTTTTSVKVDETGAFRCTVKLKSTGSTSVTIRAIGGGYKRNDVVVGVSKLVSGAERLAALRKKAKDVPYAKLAQKPASYQDKVVELTGTVSDLANTDGQPRLTLTTAEGDRYVVLCDDLLDVHEGDARTLYGTLTGAAIDGLPSLTLAVYAE